MGNKEKKKNLSKSILWNNLILLKCLAHRSK